MAVGTKVVVEIIIMAKSFAFGALRVVVIAARIANIDVIAIRINSERNFIGEEIFVALVAKQVLIVKAMRANIGAVMNHSHLAFVEIFFAMFAQAVVLVQAVVANMNAFAVAVDNLPSFGAKILALLAEFFFIRIAVVAEKPVGNFLATRNAKPISSNLENLEVIGMVLTNGNFGVEFGMKPVDVTAKAVAAHDLDSVFVAAVFFGLPEIGNAFKLGNFALNQIAIKFRFGLSPASSAVSVVEPTLK